MAYKDPNYKRNYYQINRERILAYQKDWYARNKDRAQDGIYRTRHRHRMDDLSALWDAQGGLCYLCGDELASETSRVVIEHDHSHCQPPKSCRVCRRGLAHHKCNLAVGFADDDPARLRRLADALEVAQQAVEQRKSSAGRQLSLLGDPA